MDKVASTAKEIANNSSFSTDGPLVTLVRPLLFPIASYRRSIGSAIAESPWLMMDSPLALEMLMSMLASVCAMVDLHGKKQSFKGDGKADERLSVYQEYYSKIRDELPTSEQETAFHKQWFEWYRHVAL